MSKHRYFLFTYQHKGGNGFGTALTSTNGRFPSYRYIENLVRANDPGDVMVTGWNEFKSKSDFEDFQQGVE